jgi:hypothetical protein
VATFTATPSKHPARAASSPAWAITAATMKGDKGAKFESMIGDLQNVL